MRRGVVAVVIAAALLVGSVAEAHARSFGSVIRFTRAVVDGNDVERVVGVVESNRAQCIRERKVVAFFKESGEDEEVYGKTLTNSEGRWVIEENGPAGEIYRFVVRRKTIVRNGHRHECRADDDATLIFEN